MIVHIGTWKGRVTFAEVSAPWDKPQNAPGSSLLNKIGLSLVAVGLLFAILLARRNWKLGRADRKGALRIGAARFLLAMAAWIATVHALPEGSTLLMFFQSIGDWLLSAGMLWILYLALEPEVRARWPHSIVTWNRLLAGRWRDAQVGAHILIGAFVGIFLWMSAELVLLWSRKPDVLDSEGGLTSLSAAGPGSAFTRAPWEVYSPEGWSSSSVFSACGCWCEKIYGLRFWQQR